MNRNFAVIHVNETLVEESVLIEIESPFGNMCTSPGQQKFLQLDGTSAENKTQHNQTKDYTWLTFVFFLEPWKHFCLVYLLPCSHSPYPGTPPVGSPACIDDSRI